RADQQRRMWLDLETGAIDPDLAVLGHAGGTPIVRSPDKAIRIGGELVVPAACDATLIAVTAQPLRVVATCAGHDWLAPVELFGPGFHANVDGATDRYGYRLTLEQQQMFSPGDVRWLEFPDEHLPEVIDAPALCLEDKTCFRIADGEVLV